MSSKPLEFALADDEALELPRACHSGEDAIFSRKLLLNEVNRSMSGLEMVKNAAGLCGTGSVSFNIFGMGFRLRMLV